MNIREYYHNRAIRKRMAEYLGEAVYIMRTDFSSADRFQPVSAYRLSEFLDQGFDVSRSFWDRKFLIAHLDVEYVNFDFPAEPYIDPHRAFTLQKPVETAIEETLSEYGICPLHLITGRGHHFAWQFRQDSAVFRQVMAIGRLPDHLREFYHQSLDPDGDAISRDLGAAFAGLSLVMEFLANRILKAACKQCRIPVMLTEVSVSPQARGKEIISIDITEYGDPLHTRIVRMPFSVYLKPWYKGNILNEDLDVPKSFVIPLHEMDVESGISVMRSAEEVQNLAKRTCTRIPDGSACMEELTADYLKSDLAEFHNFFYEEDHDPTEMWKSTYDRFELYALPEETRQVLETPNDLLLKPAGIRQVVRTLIPMGWHPRHIAGLIRSKYERNYGWGKEWYLYDAATRADFYVRVFSGAIAIGNDTTIAG